MSEYFTPLGNPIQPSNTPTHSAATMPVRTQWEVAIETKLQTNPNDHQAAKDLWLSRLLDAFSVYGISFNTDELLLNNIFVVDIINQSTQQIRVVFAHPNYRGTDRSTSEWTIWKVLVLKMRNYLCQVRQERMALREVTQSEFLDDETYFAILAVGRSVRFLALEAGSTVLTIWSGTNGLSMFDAFRDKDQIRALFWELSRNNSGIRIDLS
jgi:hypothetical protein